MSESINQPEFLQRLCQHGRSYFQELRTKVKINSFGHKNIINFNRRKYLHAVVATGGAFLLFLLAILPTSSVAATFFVNSFQDVNDLEPGNGLCVAYLIVFPPYVFPFCTLRGAIEETNKLPGPDIIHISEGTYTLTLAGTDENNAYTGDLDITDSLIITGAGVNKTFIDADSLDRVFDIFSPTSKVTISGLSVIHGSLPAGDDYQEGGGGIRNTGSLSLREISISGNHVDGEGVTTGGGILNQSTCTITNSTIEGNSARSGGGIFNEHNAILDISSCTIHDNSAETGGGLSNDGAARLVNVTINGNMAHLGSSPHGGAIWNSEDLEILQSTIAGNTTSGHGGGISNNGVVSMINTIIASNTNGNCSSADGIFSLGFNLESENTCGLDQETDIIDVDPKLDKLKNNGGPTKTQALRSGSPAIDKGKNLLAEGIQTDQRGEKRPAGDGFDIGAYERQKISIVPFLVPLLFSDKI